MNEYIYYRGGSWNYNARHVRAAIRFGDAPSDRINDLGFRIVRSYE